MWLACNRVSLLTIYRNAKPLCIYRLCNGTAQPQSVGAVDAEPSKTASIHHTAEVYRTLCATNGYALRFEQITCSWRPGTTAVRRHEQTACSGAAGCCSTAAGPATSPTSCTECRICQYADEPIPRPDSARTSAQHVQQHVLTEPSRPPAALFCATWIQSANGYDAAAAATTAPVQSTTESVCTSHYSRG